MCVCVFLFCYFGFEEGIVQCTPHHFFFLYFGVLKSIYVQNPNSIFQTEKHTYFVLNSIFTMRTTHSEQTKKLSQIHFIFGASFFFILKRIQIKKKKMENRKNQFWTEKKCIMHAKWLLWNKWHRPKWQVQFEPKKKNEIVCREEELEK